MWLRASVYPSKDWWVGLFWGSDSSSQECFSLCCVTAQNSPCRSRRHPSLIRWVGHSFIYSSLCSISLLDCSRTTTGPPRLAAEMLIKAALCLSFQRMMWVWWCQANLDHVWGDVWWHLVLEGSQSKTKWGSFHPGVALHCRQRGCQDPQSLLLHQQQPGQKLQTGEMWQLLAS